MYWSLDFSNRFFTVLLISLPSHSLGEVWTADDISESIQDSANVCIHQLHTVGHCHSQGSLSVGTVKSNSLSKQSCFSNCSGCVHCRPNY